VIGRFPGETSALCLVWAVLELTSRGWRGVVMTPRAVAEIERLRRALAAGRQLDDEAHEEVVAA
jgi:putative transposase